MGEKIRLFAEGFAGVLSCFCYSPIFLFSRNYLYTHGDLRYSDISHLTVEYLEKVTRPHTELPGAPPESFAQDPLELDTKLLGILNDGSEESVTCSSCCLHPVFTISHPS